MHCVLLIEKVILRALDFSPSCRQLQATLRCLFIVWVFVVSMIAIIACGEGTGKRESQASVLADPITSICIFVLSCFSSLLFIIVSLLLGIVKSQLPVAIPRLGHAVHCFYCYSVGLFINKGKRPVCKFIVSIVSSERHFKLSCLLPSLLITESLLAENGKYGRSCLWME